VSYPYPPADQSVSPYTISQYPAAGVYPFYNDSTFNPDDLSPVIDDVVCGWIPDISSWDLGYSTDGLNGVTQSWIVPNNPLLPLAVRQLLSWNRDRYEPYAAFYDRNAHLGRKQAPRNLVPTAIKLVPLLNGTGGVPIVNGWTSRGISSGLVNCLGNSGGVGGGTVGIGGVLPGGFVSCAFPSVITDKFRMDITWSQDEFRNRFAIQYAKVEIEPSVRLESIHGSNLGVVPLNNNGEPDELLQPDSKKIEKVTTGFPVREPQLLIKVTYPWVRFSGMAPSIIKAGPIGEWTQNVSPATGKLPDGQFLGCINDRTFMGFPKGRVLYQSADMVEKVSPVTNRLGYQITHVFMALTSASWNMVRMQGGVDNSASNDLWPYGHMIGLKKDGTLKAGVYPYKFKNLNELLYYNNGDNGGAPSVPNDEG
jgi:hypothetical protein